MMSTYDLCKNFLASLFYSDTLESSEPITTLSSIDKKQYRISSTPYRDALLKNLIKVNFKNRDHHYYSNLGDKINQIVEERCNQRSHRYWWIEEYLRESYIRKNRLLKRKQYCVVKRHKIMKKVKIH